MHRKHTVYLEKSLTIQGRKKESPYKKKSGTPCECCLTKIKTEEAVGSAIYSNQNRDKIYKTNFPEQSGDKKTNPNLPLLKQSRQMLVQR
jgi:hypothetical protein